MTQYIDQETLAKHLDISLSKLSKLKRQLNYPRGYRMKVSDIPKIKKLSNQPFRKGGRTNPLFPGYYEHALAMIEKIGYITRSNLVDIFQISSVTHAQAYFEARGNPLYDDYLPDELWIKTGTLKKKGEKIYKLWNPLRDKWRREAMHKPAKNGCVSFVGKNK